MRWFILYLHIYQAIFLVWRWSSTTLTVSQISFGSAKFIRLLPVENKVSSQFCITRSNKDGDGDEKEKLRS